jgi:ABC-type lipoprotein release transport system permease subunit
MNATRWLIRSLKHHRRMHAAVAGGAALAAAVLAAALLTGDALNRNLRRIALERVGGIRSAVELRGRFVDASLADRLARESNGTVAPVLRLAASVLTVTPDGAESRVDRVNAYGVDERFLALAPSVAATGGRGPRPAAAATKDGGPGDNDAPLPAGDVLLSRRLQDALGFVPSVAATGGRGPRPAAAATEEGGPAGSALPDAAVALRFEQPSAFPLEMPLGDRRDDRTRRRPVQVRGVLPDAALGRFSLAASQIPPLNVFADRAWLAGEAGVSNRANLLLSDALPERMAAALRATLLPSDLGVSITAATNGVWLVQSDRVYLDEAHVRALGTNLAAVFTLHHLVDSFESGGSRGRSPSSAETNTVLETPYGFITAATPSADARLSVVPAGMKDDEIVINAWLAEKLKVGVGDPLTLRWRRFESGGRLVPDAAIFRVSRVLDMATCVVERALFPRFPGLADADRCADWDVGLAMDKEKLNDKANEEYWKAYGPTPKAFVTLAAGRLMLGTHFGSAITARVAPETPPGAILAALRGADPQELGLVARPLRQEALQAAEQAMDFRLLFVGMAIVLMAAALLLTGLLASLGVTQRREEVGILRAAGFLPRQIAFLWMSEALVPLAAGVVTGVAAGVGGARLLVWALNRFWSGAIASAQVPFSVSLDACGIAGAAALAMSLLAVRWGIGRALRVEVRDLLADASAEENCEPGSRWVRVNFAVGIGSAAAAVALLAMSGRVTGEAASGIFFGAGLLLMISLLCLARLLVQFLAGAGTQPAAGPVRAGVLNVARQRGRSLLVMVLLATGSFLTVGTLSMKQDPAANLAQPGSGSGGFSQMVELSIPLPGDKADALVRGALEPEARVLSFRVRAGDEAGCLNLNHATQPNLLGVSPEDAAALGAFERTRVEIAEGRAGALDGDSAAAATVGRGPRPAAAATGGGGEPSIWSLLQRPMADNTIPVLAGDGTTVEWGLHAKAAVSGGSVYDYMGEDGTVWHLRVVGALPVRTGVLQGSLLIDEATFTRMYPSVPGRGLWLVRSARPDVETAARLRRALGRNGAMITPARERLQLLGAVESTYLDMFLVLGGLGVVLGAAGVGLVVLRNAAARRGELATLRALGVPQRHVLRYLLAEHVYVLLAGLLAGVVPALVAVQPALRTLGQGMPAGTMAAIIVAMVLSGLLGTYAAVRGAARLRLIEALRGE